MSRPKWNSEKKKIIKEKLTNGEYRCRMCQKKFDSTDDLALEHKLPVSKGGNNDLENLTVLCKSCNGSRNNRVGNEHLKIIKNNVAKDLDKLNIDLLRYEKDIGTLNDEDIKSVLNELEHMVDEFKTSVRNEVIHYDW